MYEIVNIRVNGHDDWGEPVVIADVVNRSHGKTVFGGPIRECAEYVIAALVHV